MKHEAEQFDLPLPGVPPVQEKASRQQLIAEARVIRELYMTEPRWLYERKSYEIIGKLIEALEE